MATTFDSPRSMSYPFVKQTGGENRRQIVEHNRERQDTARPGATEITTHVRRQ
jgi:hypothetical protein